jgi:predicted ArsR family transcriptional regulator
VLTSRGYAAQAREAGSGVQLCQHHCPVAHVAAEFPELCEAETQAFAELLGTHVQRLATIARGDTACTTHVPLEAPEIQRGCTTTTTISTGIPTGTSLRGRQSE